MLVDNARTLHDVRHDATSERRRESAPLAGVRSWVRERSLRLAAALALAFAVPVGVLFYLEFRSLSVLGETWTIVLRQMSRQAVDEAVAEIDQGFRLSHTEVMNLGWPRVNLPAMKRVGGPDLPLIATVFQGALDQDPLVNRFYIWSEDTSRPAGRLAAYGRGDAEFVSEVPEGPRLVAKIHELVTNRRPYTALFELDVDGRRMYFVAQMYYSYYPARDFYRSELPNTRLVDFVAFSVDDEILRRTYMPSVMAKLSRATVPLASYLPPLMLTVTDERGEVVFPTDGPLPRAFVDERPLLLSFNRPASVASNVDLYQGRPPVWRIRSTYGNQTIPEIVASRLWPIRATAIALGVVMTLCIVIIVRAAAREIRLAELKSNFVASVSHDLKTPLALIQLFAESLELGRVNGVRRAREYASVVSVEARKLTRLIDNILDFSRIEAGMRHYTPAPHDLGELTADVLASMARQFEQQEFTVTSHIAPDLRQVNVDSLGARQGLENVLTNAVRYSGAARRIAVHVDEVDGYGRIRVTDYGVGIPRGLQRKIFRKFYRIHSNVSSGPQGCGLGLAIVEHVVRAHGGFVTVDSAPGRGSTFALHFPIVTEVTGVETDPGDRRRASDAARTA